MWINMISVVANTKLETKQKVGPWFREAGHHCPKVVIATPANILMVNELQQQTNQITATPHSVSAQWNVWTHIWSNLPININENNEEN